MFTKRCALACFAIRALAAAAALVVLPAGTALAQPGPAPDRGGSQTFGFGPNRFVQKDVQDLSQMREVADVLDVKKVRKALEHAVVLVPAFKTPEGTAAVAWQGGEVESEDGKKPLYLVLLLPAAQSGDPEAFFQAQDSRPYALLLSAMRESGTLDPKTCEQGRECLGKGGHPERCLAWRCGH